MSADLPVLLRRRSARVPFSLSGTIGSSSTNTRLPIIRIREEELIYIERFTYLFYELGAAQNEPIERLVVDPVLFAYEGDDQLEGAQAITAVGTGLVAGSQAGQGDSEEGIANRTANPFAPSTRFSFAPFFLQDGAGHTLELRVDNSVTVNLLFLAYGVLWRIPKNIAEAI